MSQWAFFSVVQAGVLHARNNTMMSSVVSPSCTPLSNCWITTDRPASSLWLPWYHIPVDVWWTPRCHVVLLVVSFPTNFVKSSWMWKFSPLATICFGIHWIDPSVCFENAFHTGSTSSTSSMTWLYVHYRFLSLHLSQIPIRGCLVFASCTAVVSDVTGVELFFLAQTVSGNGATRRFCVALPTSPFTFCESCLETTPKKIEIEQFFFWTVGRFVTVIQVREIHRVLGQGDIRFLFC